MRSIPLVSLAAVLALAVPACDDGAGSIPFDQLMQRTAESQCHHYFSCCDQTELMDLFTGVDPPITTEAECVTFYVALINNFFDREPIDAGRIGYDGEKAASCLARIDGAACGAEYEAAAASCDDDAGVFYGKVALGGMCKGDGECAGTGNYCPGGNANTFATCVALPAVGQQCPDGRCVSGAYCDVATCAAQKPNGQPCLFSGECQSDFCDANDQCAVEPAVVDMTCDGV